MSGAPAQRIYLILNRIVKWFREDNMRVGR